MYGSVYLEYQILKQRFHNLLMLCLWSTIVCKMQVSSSGNSFQLTGPEDSPGSTLLHIYLRNRPHFDTSKGYRVSVGVIGPL